MVYVTRDPSSPVPMPNDFVILTRARSGSTSLMSRLDSCPDVVCHGEIFKRKRIDIAREHRRRLPIATVPGRNADPLGFVAGIRGLDPDAHVGFKVFPEHLVAAPGAIAHILAPATRRIVLTRAPLETYASGLRMKATGVHSLREGDRPVPGTLDALFAFVGSSARAADSSTAFRKQHAGSLADGFENWDELQAFLGRAAPIFLDPPPPSHPPG